MSTLPTSISGKSLNNIMQFPDVLAQMPYSPKLWWVTWQVCDRVAVSETAQGTSLIPNWPTCLIL